MAMNAPGYTNHLDERQARWFAVYTRYKREKLVFRHLRDKGIHCYLPLRKLTRYYTRKIRVVELPLISCYIFTRITRKEYVQVLETPDVVSFVKFSRNLISIPEQEIRLLQRIVGEGVDIEVDPLSFREGDQVEIIGGSLTGLQGILLQRSNPKNFLIELNHIGYSLRIQVNPCWLQKKR